MVKEVVTPEEDGVDMFDDFALDEKADEGVWVPYRNGVDFLVAYAKNRKFKNRASYYYKKYTRILDGNNEAARAKLEEITIQVMAETVLLGWRGNVKFKGEKLTYSVENAKKLLGIERIRDFISQQAEDVASYKAVKEAEDLGN